MKYYATIYIHPMDWNIPHVFLGLTKDKSPDELDKIDEQLRQEYLKNKEWNKIDQKWYKQIYPSIVDNDFKDEGFFGFAPVESAPSHWGKVYENNQYIPKWDNNFQQYTYIDERPSSTFWQQNRCVLEISQEQYEVLLNEIKKEVEKTKNRNSNLQKDDSKMISLEILRKNLYYNSTPIGINGYKIFPHIHNCVTWVIQRLSDIGIEVINTDEWIPDFPILDNLKENLNTIKSLHSIFLKFQNIDDNLQSVKGARAFITWTRSMLDNNYICYVNQENLEKKIQTFCKKNIENQRYYESIKKFYNEISQLKSIYNKLDFCLESITKKFNTSIKGDFELIYFDRKDRQIKLLKADNDYEAIAIQDLDLSRKYNNFSVSKFYPFIFIPKNEMISRILYHKYDYGNISQEYQKDRNEFYFNVLAGEKSDKYWSSSYHKMTKNLRKIHVS
ncbi:hypothetical protein UPTC17655_0878 [Campylobacter lari]|uniref:hypothetical protein n=1 Tax=Campylobacter lari TaxID=201 RepID=UPI00215328E7|nr:hypothetical protein [Campylobacter lari]MCR6511608.1 hypothetical protein [Campylobacter lari]